MRLARNFQESELGQRAKANAVRELSLLFAFDDHLLQADKLTSGLTIGAERVLIDYKTDHVTAEEAEGRAQDYALQIRLYAQALKQAGGKRPDRGVLYFLRPNAAVDVDVSPGALDEARQTVRDFFAAQSQQSFPLRRGKALLSLRPLRKPLSRQGSSRMSETPGWFASERDGARRPGWVRPSDDPLGLGRQPAACRPPGTDRHRRFLLRHIP